MKFNAGVSLRNSFNVVAYREEKVSPRRGSRKAWYVRSDSRKDETTTVRPQVMQMVFFETSDYKVNSGDDSIISKPRLERTFTEEDDDGEIDGMSGNSEDSLPLTCPHSDDDSVAKVPTMEELTETVKQALNFIKDSEMKMFDEVTETEITTVASRNERKKLPRIPSTGTTNL